MSVRLVDTVSCYPIDEDVLRAAVRAYLEIEYLQARVDSFGGRMTAYERDMGACIDREIERRERILDEFRSLCKDLGLKHKRVFDSAMLIFRKPLVSHDFDPLRKHLEQMLLVEEKKPEIERQLREEARKELKWLREKTKRDRALEAARNASFDRIWGISTKQSPPRRRSTKRPPWIRSKRELKKLLKLDPTRWEPTGYAINLAHWPECDLDIDDDAVSEAIREYTGREPVPGAL